VMKVVMKGAGEQGKGERERKRKRERKRGCKMERLRKGEKERMMEGEKLCGRARMPNRRWSLGVFEAELVGRVWWRKSGWM